MNIKIINKGLILVSMLSMSLYCFAGGVEEEKNNCDIFSNTECVPTDLQLKNPEWIEYGSKKFALTCGYCHGSQGDSGKNKAFRKRPADWDKNYIFKTIHDGKKRGANVMPAWGESLSDDQIWQIVAFIKSLSGAPKN
ncbi:cytochrome c [Neptuniibacter sp. CAU 1671]|uniref:c-type cytochrome n=1 Tax=Neptuniibacter sp. CAU 1671 TaxID=3032593 RepID=UPI0023DC26C8|nr:cytochrome c [Neptuniibacter sp. CAU 1671]MDF2180570.1 cytochrome c [Neptuniibacter sp. CAU 1671]